MQSPRESSGFNLPSFERTGGFNSERMKYNLRKAGFKDYELLYNINKQAFKPYVEKVWGWDEDSQRERFKSSFEIKNTSLLIVNKKPVGFYKVDYGKDKIFVESIALIKDFQSKGIGTKILQKIIQDSEKRNLPIYLRVLKVNNRAKMLYERLGFKQYAETKTHFLMIR